MQYSKTFRNRGTGKERKKKKTPLLSEGNVQDNNPLSYKGPRNKVSIGKNIFPCDIRIGLHNSKQLCINHIQPMVKNITSLNITLETRGRSESSYSLNCDNFIWKMGMQQRMACSNPISTWESTCIKGVNTTSETQIKS